MANTTQLIDVLLMHSFTTSNTSDHGEVACQDVHFHQGDKCDFVRYTFDCNNTLSLIDYIEFMYCRFSDQLPLAIGICIVWVVLLFISLAVTATDFLCPSLFVISKRLRLSQNVAGATIVGFGNASADIFAAIAGMRQGRPDLVVGALLGGGAFVTLFVIGSIFALSKKFKLQGEIFIRDCVFYLIAIAWIFYCFVGPNKIQLHDALGFLLLYLFYVLVVLLSKYCCKTNESGVIGHHGHGHGPAKKSEKRMSMKKEHKITFEGIKPDKDPDEGMIVMKGFLFLTDTTLSENRRKAMSIKKRKNLPNVIPIIKITPDKDENSIRIGGHTSNQTHQNQAENNSNAVNTSNKDSDIIHISSNNKDDNNNGNNNQNALEDASVYSTVSSTMDLYGTRTSNKSNTASIFTLTINQEHLVQIRRASREFLEKITPIDKDVWKHQNWGGKGFEIIKAPIRFFLLLTTPMADLEEKEEWNKPLSVLHCISGPLFVLLATGFFGVMIFNYIPLALIVFIVASIIAVVIVLTSRLETPPGYYTAYSSYLGFVVSVTWIYLISNEAVSAIRSIGVAFNLSEIAIGMTMLAWGNCLLDFISNLSIARKGFPKMAIAACLGAPLLSLLSGVGLVASLQLLTDTESIPVKPDKLITIIYFAISFFLILTNIKLLFFKFHVKKSYGIFLVVTYVFLIIFTFLVEWKFIELRILSQIGFSR